MDIKDLDLSWCRKLDMNSTLEKVAFNFKNIEALGIAGTNVTVLTGRRNLALSEFAYRRLQ